MSLITSADWTRVSCWQECGYEGGYNLVEDGPCLFRRFGEIEGRIARSVHNLVNRSANGPDRCTETDFDEFPCGRTHVATECDS